MQPDGWSTVTSADAVAEFWRRCREAVNGLPDEAPDAWAFGATAEHADELLALVLAGVKTGTASSLWDHEYSHDPLPAVGDFSIILDASGSPSALIVTTDVTVVPFSDVDAEHAASEGEGDRTLAAWRDMHERFWREHSEDPRGFAPDMPVVCERFRLVHPVPH